MAVTKLLDGETTFTIDMQFTARRVVKRLVDKGVTAISYFAHTANEAEPCVHVYAEFADKALQFGDDKLLDQAGECCLRQAIANKLNAKEKE